jgi:hypothetical protein
MPFRPTTSIALQLFDIGNFVFSCRCCCVGGDGAAELNRQWHVQIVSRRFVSLWQLMRERAGVIWGWGSWPRQRSSKRKRWTGSRFFSGHWPHVADHGPPPHRARWRVSATVHAPLHGLLLMAELCRFSSLRFGLFLPHNWGNGISPPLSSDIFSSFRSLDSCKIYLKTRSEHCDYEYVWLSLLCLQVYQCLTDIAVWCINYTVGGRWRHSGELFSH